MKENSEISALLQLIEDPDAEVYQSVSEKIATIGKAIIPNLENLWEATLNEEVQERIEMLIHQLHYKDLFVDMESWKENPSELLEGALLAANYHYPDADGDVVRKQIEKMRRNVWLELSYYLTPMEQVNILNSIFFSYYKQKGTELNYKEPGEFLINQSLEAKKGNALSNGIIYLILCEKLDIPVKALAIPRQFILGFIDLNYDALNPKGHASQKVKFYIDGLSGQMYSHKDIEGYFKRMNVPPVNSYFKPLTNVQVIKFLLEEYAKCFDNDRDRYKLNELISLANILGE